MFSYLKPSPLAHSRTPRCHYCMQVLWTKVHNLNTRILCKHKYIFYDFTFYTAVSYRIILRMIRAQITVQDLTVDTEGML